MGNKIYDALMSNKTYKLITERIDAEPQALSFLNGRFGDIHAWRKACRERIYELLRYNPEPAPFNTQILAEEDFGDYVRKTITFDSAKGVTVPAYLLIPKNVKLPAPAVVAMHDHGGMFFWGKYKTTEHKEPHPTYEKYAADLYGGRPLASALARRGYVVITIDSLFFGERAFPVEAHEAFKQRLAGLEYASPEYIRVFNNCAREVEADLTKLILSSGTTFMGPRLWDDMASVSFLASLPEVDKNRIGVAGISMGGHRTTLLCAMDDRVKCGVAVGTMQRYREMMKKKIHNISWLWVVPGLFGDMDYPELASLRAPLPFYVMHGKKDGLYPDNTGEMAIEHVERVYEKAGAAGNFKYKYYDVPHEFNVEMQDEAFDWMNGWLK